VRLILKGFSWLSSPAINSNISFEHFYSLRIISNQLSVSSLSAPLWDFLGRSSFLLVINNSTLIASLHRDERKLRLSGLSRQRKNRGMFGSADLKSESHMCAGLGFMLVVCVHL